MTTYLYSYGNRRHIADPDASESRDPKKWAVALCGLWCDTEAYMRAAFQHLSATHAARAINRKMAEPLCKRCEKKAFDS